MQCYKILSAICISYSAVGLDENLGGGGGGGNSTKGMLSQKKFAFFEASEDLDHFLCFLRQI